MVSQKTERKTILGHYKIRVFRHEIRQDAPTAIENCEEYKFKNDRSWQKSTALNWQRRVRKTNVGGFSNSNGKYFVFVELGPFTQIQRFPVM